MVFFECTGYTSNQEKKCPLYGFNPMGGQITVKPIEALFSYFLLTFLMQLPKHNYEPVVILHFIFLTYWPPLLSVVSCITLHQLTLRQSWLTPGDTSLMIEYPILLVVSPFHSIPLVLMVHIVTCQEGGVSSKNHLDQDKHSPRNFSS